jgi:hypothetical protein
MIFAYDNKQKMKKTIIPQCGLYLAGLMMTSVVNAQSWVDEGAREFEELRLRQLQTVQGDSDITAFTSDGCSGGQSKSWELLAQALPEFTGHFGDKPPWESCCVAHDKVYWRGSTVDGYTKRKLADEELRQCIAVTGVEFTPEISSKYALPEEKVRQSFSLAAELMYQAVRLGGQPCSLLPWRWGYGWDNCAFASIGDIPGKVSNLKYDEHITFFNTAAWLDNDNAYWYIPIHAWIYEPQNSVVRNEVIASLLNYGYDLTVTSENEQNFRQRTNLLIADNERDKTLVIRFTGQDITLPVSAENGKTFTILKLPAEVVKAFSNQGRLEFFAVLQDNDKRQFKGQVKLVPRDGISVISDIDDTIKISNVTDHRRLLDNSLLKDFQEVAGMPELYQRLAKHGVTIHYVSSSPWQLYDPLYDFIRSAGFPWATLDLKDVRFRDETLFNLSKKGTETKPGQIEPILQHHAERQFILVGDSGEQDPEVYGDIARRYPAQIYRILIRNADNSKAEDLRFKEAFNHIARNTWRLFDHPGQISIDDLLIIK